MKAIKKIHQFLSDFCVLKEGISHFHAKESTWTSQKPCKMGHTLYQKDLQQESQKGTRSDMETQWLMLLRL